MVAGIICCAVGIWLITERKRGEEQRGHVEGALGEQGEYSVGNPLGMLERELADALEVDGVDDERGIEPLQLIEALLADAEELHLPNSVSVYSQQRLNSVQCIFSAKTF